MINAEIIAIGSELLLGTTIDTNSAYLAERLASGGVRVRNVSVVGDDHDQIVITITTALARADLVICTGGLGPTLDDVTREAVATALRRPLEFRQELLDQIAARFAAMQRPMGESNRRQAFVPAGARAIPNPRGTAPSFLVEDQRGTIMVLPGVPHEMRALVETALLPYLREECGIRDVILTRTLHVAGMGESIVGECLADLMVQDNPTLGTAAKLGRIELRLVARADSHAVAVALLDKAERTISERLGEAYTGSLPIQHVIPSLLRERGYSLALAEDHTAAPIYHALCDGDPNALSSIRGVLIESYETVEHCIPSSERAYQAAHYIRERWKCDIALAMQHDPPGEDGMSHVSIVLTTPQGSTTTTRTYDLGDEEGWHYVAMFGLTTLLDMLRP